MCPLSSWIAYYPEYMYILDLFIQYYCPVPLCSLNKLFSGSVYLASNIGACLFPKVQAQFSLVKMPLCMYDKYALNCEHEHC